jgi:hypothetical protein
MEHLELAIGFAIGIPMGWQLNVFLRGTLVPLLIRHGWR